MSEAREDLLGRIEGSATASSVLRAFTRVDTCNPPGDTRACEELLDGVAAELRSLDYCLPDALGGLLGALPDVALTDLLRALFHLLGRRVNLGLVGGDCANAYPLGIGTFDRGR